MKKILLSLSLLLGSFAVNAQLSCEAPTVITAAGTFTAPAITTGTYGNDCWGGVNNQGGQPLRAVWYSYTPTANGMATFSSDVLGNPAATDTRVSVFKGTCAALECYAGNDDISGTNYRSAVSFPVAAGTTYYVAWDNNWSAAGFQFSVTFTAGGCLYPNVFEVADPINVTANSASLSWAAAVGSPASYDVDYGTVGHAAGSGTIVNTTTTSVDLSGLTAGPDYHYFIRSNCGATQSTWVGPFAINLVTSLPYATGFDQAGNNQSGFTLTDGFVLSTSAANATYANSPTAFLFTNTSATATANAYAFFRPIYLQANEQVTVNFKTRFLGAAADNASFQATVGTEPTAEAQTTVLQSYTQAGGAATYTDRIANYTAPAAGIYYFAFHNNSAPTSDTFSLLFDTVNITSILSLSDLLAGKFTVYPNPASDFISIRNTENITVKSVSITDLNGRVVKKSNIADSANISISVSDLSKGMYLMTIDTERGQVIQKISKK